MAGGVGGLGGAALNYDPDSSDDDDTRTNGQNGRTPPSISSTYIDDGVMNTAYTFNMRASGDAPIEWELHSGALPTGLSLNSATGEISGTPTVLGSFTFTLKAMNGAGNDTCEYTIGVTNARLPVPTGLAWSDAAKGTATWTAVEHAVGYRVQLYKSGEALASEYVTGTSFSFKELMLAEAAKDENSAPYTFTVSAVSDGTAYSSGFTSGESASYTHHVHIIDFYPNGGGGARFVIIGEPGEPFTMPVCTFTAPANKVFDSWLMRDWDNYPDHEIFIDPGETYSFGSTATTWYPVDAQWAYPVYAVTYTLNGGAVSPADANPISYTPDTASFTLVNPTRAEYEFVGWSGTGITGAPVSEVTVPRLSHGDRTYTANWIRLESTVTFDANGGSGDMSSAEARAHTSLTLPDCAFTPPENCRFVAWAIGSPDGDRVDAGDAYSFIDNTTVYAIWRALPPASENVIDGIEDGYAFSLDSAVPFEALGGGRDNNSPLNGDVRWNPSAWNIGSSRGSFDDGAFVGLSASALGLGEHTLTVTFTREVYDGTRWVVTTTVDTKSVTFSIVASPLEPTPTPAPDNLPETGDAPRVFAYIALAFAAVGLLLLLGRARRAD